MAVADVLRVGILTPLQQQNGDPRETTDFVNGLVNGHVYQSPIGLSADGTQALPLLFDGPLQAEPTDEQIWSARLRSGLRFSDGTVLTARHLARSLVASDRFASEADVEVSGDKLIFHLKRPNSRFDWTLCHPTHAVVLSKRGQHMGTGPYVLVPGSDPDQIRLVRNPHYPKPPSIPRIDLRVYPLDADGRPTRLIHAVNQGEVDFTSSLSRDDLKRVRGVHKWMGQGASVAFLFFNTRRPYLRNPEIRNAISRAVDRRELAAQSYSSPLAFAATGLLPPFLGALPDGIRLDLDDARKRLEAAGGATKRTPLRMLVIHTSRPYMPHPTLTAERIAAQIGRLGLEVQLEPVRGVEDFYRRTAGGDYDLALSGWIPETPDLVSLFEALLSSERIPDEREGAFSRGNLARFSHPEMDAALAAYRRDASSVNLRRVGQVLNQERPFLPLLYGSEILVHSWRVKTRSKHYINRPFFAEMSL